MNEKKNLVWWNEYFSDTEGWEGHGGRAQSKIFAEAFVSRLTKNKNDSFSLLDAGCALGDAIKVIASHYPNAQLTGLDFSEAAISQCKLEMPDIAEFIVGNLDDVMDKEYDIIFCSNTLEHFPDFEKKARNLALRCSILSIMVPYNELVDGHHILPNENEHHQNTFLEDSFNYLIEEGIAVKISSEIFSCPGAWGWTSWNASIQYLKNILRPMIGKKRIERPYQIYYKIQTK